MTYKADCPNSEGVLQSFVVEEFDDHIVLCVYSSNNVSKDKIFHPR